MHQIEGLKEPRLGALRNSRLRVFCIEKALHFIFEVKQLELLLEILLRLALDILNKVVDLLIILLHHINHSEEDPRLWLIDRSILLLRVDE